MCTALPHACPGNSRSRRRRGGRERGGEGRGGEVLEEEEEEENPRVLLCHRAAAERTCEVYLRGVCHQHPHTVGSEGALKLVT